MTSALPLPGLLRRPAAAILDTTLALAGLPARALSLLSSAERTLGTVDGAVVRVEELLERLTALVETAEQTASGAADVVTRAGTVTGRADGVVTAADQVSSAAAETVEQASAAAGNADSLLRRYQEPLLMLEPTVRRLAETSDPKEVDGLVSLIDRLPRLATSMDEDIIPLLYRLDQIGPDLHRLLEVVTDLNRLVSRLPEWVLPQEATKET